MLNMSKLVVWNWFFVEFMLCLRLKLCRARLAKEEEDRNNAFAKRLQKLGQAEKRFQATTGL